MMVIEFDGWFECRLATDPDPSDEPRGVSGWTFALPEEPDLDRVIRTTLKGRVNRALGPTTGVTVRTVRIDGLLAPSHPFVGSPVELLDDPVFEGRNGLAFEDQQEPIYPFHLRLQHDGVLIRREFRDPENGAWKLQQSRGVSRRPDLLPRAGIGDLDAYVAERRAKLSAARDAATDEVARVGFDKRLSDLDLRDFAVSIMPLTIGLSYRYVMEGRWLEIQDPHGKLGCRVRSDPWIAELWAGCWDADLLCGFMS
jgi:hypothetical protein